MALALALRRHDRAAAAHGPRRPGSQARSILARDIPDPPSDAATANGPHRGSRKTRKEADVVLGRLPAGVTNVDEALRRLFVSVVEKTPLVLTVMRLGVLPRDSQS